MKATQFIFGGIILLLCAAMFLILKSEMDEKHELMMDELARSRQQPAAVAPAPAPAPTPSLPVAPAPQAPSEIAAPAAALQPPAAMKSPLPAGQNDPAATAGTEPAAAPAEVKAIVAEEERLLAEARKAAMEKLSAKGIHISEKIPGDEAYTPLQAQIAKKPAIARIEDARAEASAQGFVMLDRGSLVNLEPKLKFSVRRGTMIIGELVISDTVQEKNCVADVTWVVPGIVLKPGDEVIDYFPPNSAPPPEGATADLAAPALNPAANPDNVLTENSPPHETSAPVAPGAEGSPLPAPDTAAPRGEVVPEVAPLPR